MDREQEQKVNSPNATTREAMAEARALPTSDKVQIQPTADQPSARRDPAICKHGLLTTVNNCPKCSADQQSGEHS
jgi:hypothetical protein